MNEVGLSAAECVDLHPRVGHVSHIFRTARQPCASSINSTGKIRCQNYAKKYSFPFNIFLVSYKDRSGLSQRLAAGLDDQNDGY